MKNLILIGSYGSGKTQLAINLAISWLKQEKLTKVSLIDLDIVNPYFRSRELATELEELGVEMILPQKDFILTEAPALPPAIAGRLKDKEYRVILDVGGDSAGAIVLGRYTNQLKATDTACWMVVNTCRPGTSTATEIQEMVATLNATSNLEITGFINNTNLGLETTPDLIIEGLKELETVADKLQIPIIMTTVENHLFADLKNMLPVDHEIFPLKIYLRPQWHDTGKGRGLND